MARKPGEPADASRDGAPPAAPDPAADDPLAAIPFEQALAELESIVARMEGGSLSLEDSLAEYRRGAALVARCRRTLADVQQQVRVLEDGLLVPFDVDAPAGGPA